MLRTATAPMTCREIVDAVLKARGITADKRQWMGIEQGIRSALEDHVGGTVQRVGEGVPKRWQLPEFRLCPENRTREGRYQSLTIWVSNS